MKGRVSTGWACGRAAHRAPLFPCPYRNTATCNLPVKQAILPTAPPPTSFSSHTRSCPHRSFSSSSSSSCTVSNFIPQPPQQQRRPSSSQLPVHVLEYVTKRGMSGRSSSLGDPEINPYYWGLKHLGHRKFFDLSDTSISRNGRAPRMYFNVNLEAAKDVHGREAFLLTIDDKAVLTSGLRMPFVIPSLELAQAICIEWASQGRTIEYHAMPLTTLACLALDSTTMQREMVIDELPENIELDTVLQRKRPPNSRQDVFESSEESEDKVSSLQARVAHLMTGVGSEGHNPNALATSGDYSWLSQVDNKKLEELEEKYHQPIINWFNSTYNINLKPGAFGHVQQNHKDLMKLQGMHEVLDDWTLAALIRLGSILSSPLIPWALYKDAINTDEAFEAARVEHKSLDVAVMTGVHGNATDLTHDVMMIKAAKVFWNLLGQQPEYEPSKPEMKPLTVRGRFAL